MDQVIAHLEKIRDRMLNTPDIGAVAAAIAETKEIIQKREGFASNFVFNLGMIPVRTKVASYTAPQVVEAINSYISFSQAQLPDKKIEVSPASYTFKPFVHPDRISELRALNVTKFDLTRLIRYCEELNTCYAAGCWISVAMLSRAVLDHLPPIFGLNSFKEVANNYGSKSFKDIASSLENTTRKIADSNLHTHIRQTESLPTSNQIDCSAPLDFLLGEVVRVLK